MNRYTDADEARADYEAEMARDGADDWDSLTSAEQQALIEEQEAAAWVAAERRAELSMSRDLWRGF